MSIQEIAARLVELCRQGQYETAQRELYAEDAISIEPEGAKGFPDAKNLAGIIEKGAAFRAMIEEVHGGSVSDPVIAGDHFSISLIFEATFKGLGRQKMEEIVVYRVKDGKIVLERFFYTV
ncbi:MAG: nuclear transport factor 2 family protein [Bacteroidota bacterium]